MKNFLSKNNKGESLIEILVVIVMLGIFLPALLGLFVIFYKGIPIQSERIQALGYLKEEEEALRSLYNSSWSDNTGTYYASSESGNWVLTSGTETLSQFSRSVLLSHALRDTNGNIVSSSGATDWSTIKAVITVSWTSPINSSVSSTLYFTKIFNNDSKIQSNTDFTASDAVKGSCVDTSVDGGGNHVIKYNGALGGCDGSVVANRTFTSGVFSPLIDNSSNPVTISLNNMTWITNPSQSTNFSFQIASCNQSVSSDCNWGTAPYDYVGYDGTISTSFSYVPPTTPTPTSPVEFLGNFSSIVTVDGNHFYGKYFRYKIITTQGSSDTLTSVNMNYSN